MSETTNIAAVEDKIKIADEVIAIIAGIAVSEVENVICMGGGIGDGIAGMLGRKNLAKGIKVDVRDKEVVLEISILVDYGYKIHILAREIQEKVRNVVEEMTGLKVLEVNVNIHGVNLDKDNIKSEKEEAVEQIQEAQ